MERNDFRLVDVVTFFFVSAASRKSYLSSSACESEGAVCRGRGRRKATRFLRERWRACRRSRCTGDGGEVTNYSSLSAAPVFKGARIPPRESSGAERQARGPPEFLVLLSIINLRRQCLQHPSVTSSRISLVQSSGSLCRPRPKVYEAFTVSGTLLRSLTDDLAGKKLLSQFVPASSSIEKF